MIEKDVVLDAKGLACPMPIVKTRKVMKELNAGEVLEVQATDKGSTADIKSWAEGVGHYYLGTTEENSLLKHYLRKASGEERQENKYPHIISNDEVQKLLMGNSDALILDVRESAEYAFGHIPNAHSLPLGELENGIQKFDKDREIYVVCRSGNRSDVASQKLTALGFTAVKNIVPGMSKWNGEIEQSI